MSYDIMHFEGKRKKPSGKMMDDDVLSRDADKWQHTHRKKRMSKARYKKIAGRWV